MIPAAFLDHTSRRFPRFIQEEIEVEPLEKGGSGRKYYRLSSADAGSLILVKYTDQREENRHFCDIARFLHGLGISVPEIYFHDTEEGLIWVEDLGSVDLWSYRLESWEKRQALYRSTLDQVVRIHTRGHHALDKADGSTGVNNGAQPPIKAPHFQNAFDFDLYRWEQNYFFENCIERHFGCERAAIGAETHAKLAAIAERLAALPRVLVHRDFQSQNVMIKDDGSAQLIDFQGMRPGLGGYDLASLLYDPYVVISDEERASLKADYIRFCAEAGAPVSDDFEEIFHLCAMQRLMQALGAYGFLGHVTGHPQFLQHIPAALRLLREVTTHTAGLEPLTELLESLLARTTATAATA